MALSLRYGAFKPWRLSPRPRSTPSEAGAAENLWPGPSAPVSLQPRQEFALSALPYVPHSHHHPSEWPTGDLLTV